MQIIDGLRVVGDERRSRQGLGRKKKERREARARQMSRLHSSGLRLHERPPFRFVLQNRDPRVVIIWNGVRRH